VLSVLSRSNNTSSPTEESLRVLVVGYNTRHIVCSAKRAGFYVESVSHYEDRDLIKCGDVTRLIRDASPDVDTDADYRSLKALLSGISYDYAILASGFETLDIPRVVGNPPSLASFVDDKDRLRHKLESLDYPVPQHFDLEDNLKFPIILKPKRGAGGFRNVLVRDKQHLTRSIEQYHENGWDDLCLQEYVQGADASASVLSTGKQALTIAINEQLIGIKSLGPLQRFSFCGSVTPLKTSFARKIEEISNSLATDLGLVGTNGIDFIIGANGPVIIEVNPRFQATLDTIEGALGINLVDAHIKSCQGELVPRMRYSRFACRTVYFAERDFYVKKTCEGKNFMDIPRKGTFIERAKPVISAIGYGKSRDCAFNNAFHYIETVKRYIGAGSNNSALSGDIRVSKYKTLCKQKII
jgi:predicted ATP-grasp superfamily ATP-dependent carboligase